MRTREREALDTLTEVYEQERTAAAEAVHDGPLQHLAAASLRLQSAVHNGELSPTVAAQAAADVDAAAAELRAVMTDLMPYEVGGRTLADAVGDYVAWAFRGSGSTYSLSVEAGWELLPRHGAAVYRLVQAAVGGVLRHPQAREIALRVGRRDDDVLVEIRDAGAGFVACGGESWCELMLQRIEAVGGSLEIDSRPDGGTTVIATLHGVFS
jgi:signal transduction histidine kinase